MKQALLIVLLLPLMVITQAQHLKGGEITYEHVGSTTQPYLYKIKLTLYRGYTQGMGPLDSVQKIQISSTCYGDSVLELQRLIPPPNLATSDNGLALPRAYNCIDSADTNAIHISAHRYEDTITLGGPCVDYRFSFITCCRDTGLSNYLIPASDTLYLEATLNHSANSFIPNSSINFDFSPLVNTCLNNNTQLSFGAKDPNGDSLHYEILRPSTGENSYLNWAVGYSQNNPVQNSNGFIFYERYGIMRFTPAIPEKVALRVKVSEYHYGSILPMFFLIGSATREMVLNVTPSCSNPTLSPLFNSDTSNIDTSARFYCHDQIIKLKLNYEIQVDKIAKDGSNFRLVDAKNNSPIPIIEAGALNPLYSGLYTKEVWIKSFLPITRNDTFNLSIKPGLQGTKLITSCEHEFTSETVRLVVDDCKPIFSLYEKELSNTVLAYPNPVNSLLTLQIPNGSFEGNLTLNIYDVWGKLIESHKTLANHTSKVEVSCEHLKPGVYFIQLKQPNQHSDVIKIIKD